MIENIDVALVVIHHRHHHPEDAHATTLVVPVLLGLVMNDVRSLVNVDIVKHTLEMKQVVAHHHRKRSLMVFLPIFHITEGKMPTEINTWAPRLNQQVVAMLRELIRMRRELYLWYHGALIQFC